MGVQLAKALEAKGLSARERAKLKREQRMMAQSSANDKMMEKRRRDGTAGSDVSSRHKQVQFSNSKTTPVFFEAASMSFLTYDLSSNVCKTETA